MLSWITGSAIDSGNADATFMDVPETPTHLFAVRAFKQAFFGTPQPVTPFIPKLNGASFQQNLSTSENKSHENQKVARNGSNKSIPVNKGRQQGERINSAPASSPTKPQGILMTPGTAASRRKQVKFGEKVVDNEGKTGKSSLSGLPDHYPGKFPSPWTPKIVSAGETTDQLSSKSGETSSSTSAARKLKSRFKEALDGGANQNSVSSRTVGTKDDSDITTDLSLPHSASGRYWKEQYETYSTRSETELNRLITKHRIAKDYARMKDEEVTALKARLEIDRCKRKEREESLEKQIKDLRERLRVTMAENANMAAELSVLRASHDSSSSKTVKPSSSFDKFDKIRTELADVGFKDVEIPISRPTLQNNDTRKAFEGQKSSLSAGPESHGQDIWLDHDDDIGNRTRRMVKSAELLAATYNPNNTMRCKDVEQHGLLNDDQPLSSKAIRQKLNNPLASRCANIIGKRSNTSAGERSDDLVNFATDLDKSFTSGAQSNPSISHRRGKSPRSVKEKSLTSIIGEKRKDSALARIEQRRKTKRESRSKLKQDI